MICKRCGKEKEFNLKDKRTNALGWCKDCFCKYDKECREHNVQLEYYPNWKCGCGKCNNTKMAVNSNHKYKGVPLCFNFHSSYLNKGKTLEEIYGQERSLEIHKKMSDNHIVSDENKELHRLINLGRKHTDKARKNMSEAQKRIGKRPPIHRGKESHLWRGGVTPLNAAIRGCLQYKAWTRSILIKDKFTCVDCGQIGGKLQSHHIKLFSKILRENNIKTLEQALACEELWDINNGRTVCIKCHDVQPEHRWSKNNEHKLTEDINRTK